MPIYEYRCQACSHMFETLQKISDEPPKECPECGVSPLKKLVSAAGFKLKGSGWYETDFKHSGKKKSEPDKKSSGKPSDAKKSDKK